MLRFEMKKVFSKPVNKVVLLVLVAVVLIGVFLTIRDVRYVTETGKTISGISAARQLRNDKNKWKGDITKEVLKQIVKENNAINRSAEAVSDDLIDNEKAYAKKQSFSDIREMLNHAFTEFGEYDYYKADSLSPDEAGGLYKKRISGLKEYLNSEEGKSSFSQKEKDYLIQQYRDLKTPLHYEYMEGWKALLDSQYLPTLMIVVVVIIGFLVSGIFSDEFLLKADSIFFSAKLGRNRAVFAKLKAGFLIITGIYWGVMFLYSIIVLGALGFGGAGCMIQAGSDNWESMYHITYFQEWIFTMLGGYIGNLFILLLAMFVSAKCRSTVVAITIPFALSCVPMFLGRIPAFTRIINCFPDMLLRINTKLDLFLICEIGGKVYGLFTILILFYLFLYFAIVPMLYCSYKKTEVK